MFSKHIMQFHDIPPVVFDELLKMKIDCELRTAIDELLEKKKATAEGELNPHIPAIQSFIHDELQNRKRIVDSLPDDRCPDWSKLNRCFAETIKYHKYDAKSSLH